MSDPTPTTTTTPVPQQSSIPTRKVTAGALSGAIVSILLWAIETYGHTMVPSYVAAALVVIVSFAVAYIVKDLPNVEVDS